MLISSNRPKFIVIHEKPKLDTSATIVSVKKEIFVSIIITDINYSIYGEGGVILSAFIISFRQKPKNGDCEGKNTSNIMSAFSMKSNRCSLNRPASGVVGYNGQTVTTN